MSCWGSRITCDLEEEGAYFYRFAVYSLIVSCYLELLEGVLQILSVFAQQFIFSAYNIINVGWRVERV